MEKLNYVDIFDSAPHLFIGVTGDLEKRAAQPRRKLVWFEPHSDLRSALERERQLKKWNRAWKAKLGSEHNPERRDLYPDFGGGPLPPAPRQPASFDPPGAAAAPGSPAPPM